MATSTTVVAADVVFAAVATIAVATAVAMDGHSRYYLAKEKSGRF